jgi:hypothetical protein
VSALACSCCHSLWCTFMLGILDWCGFSYGRGAAKPICSFLTRGEERRAHPNAAMPRLAVNGNHDKLYKDHGGAATSHGQRLKARRVGWKIEGRRLCTASVKSGPTARTSASASSLKPSRVSALVRAVSLMKEACPQDGLVVKPPPSGPWGRKFDSR